MKRLPYTFLISSALCVPAIADDTVSAGVAVTNSFGSASLSGPAFHTVGGPSADVLPSADPGSIPDHFIGSTVSDTAGVRTIDVIIYASPDLLNPLAQRIKH